MTKQAGARQSAQGSYIAQATEGGSARVDVTHISYGDVRPHSVDDETLQDAFQQLEKLPLEEVASLAGLPHGSRLPLSRNHFFVGRDERFKVLAKILKAGDAELEGQVVTVAVTGIGGVGKSQLANEFAHRYGQYFSGGVFWLNFANPSAISAEVASCGGAGGMEVRPDFDRLSLEDQVGTVMAAWQNELPRLLIFDNCEDEMLLKRWRPPMGGCRVLVTSRRERWDPVLGVRTLALNVLDRHDGIALLCRYRSDLSGENPALSAIAEELGDLPLALQLAGHHLYYFDVEPREYLAQLRNLDPLQHPSMQEGGISLTDHVQDVVRTFALSYERLSGTDPTDALAVKLLARAARFAPGEPIPRELLLSTLDSLEDEPDARRQTVALSRLTELGLLETQKSRALRMHRLVTWFVRRVADDEEAQTAVEEALSKTVSDLADEGYPAPLLAWLPHLKVVTDAARGREDKRAADLCNILGYCLRVVGAASEARPLYERALAIREKVLGPEHPDTTVTLSTLAILLAEQGHIEEARALHEQDLAIREKVLGPEHPDTAASLNNLAVLLDNRRRYDEARPLYERALAIREKVLGDHPDTALTLDNLAAMLAEQGHYEEARSLLERALAINKKVHGRYHPDTAITLNNLASMLAEQGRYDEARPLHERALAIRENVFGEENPLTAITLDNLASVLEHQGDYEGARSYYERALAIREKVLGEEHPDTAVSLNNLGVLLAGQDDYEGARSYYERALAIRKKVHGEENPETAVTLNNLAILLDNQGDYDEARSYYERALAIREKVLGDHPDTAVSLSGLAAMLVEQGRYDEARPHYERALAIREKMLGKNHPETEMLQQNLRSLYGP